jgi:hypothetical protein
MDRFRQQESSLKSQATRLKMTQGGGGRERIRRSIPLLLHIHSYIICGVDNGPVSGHSSLETHFHPIITVTMSRISETLLATKALCVKNAAAVNASTITLY